MTLQFQQQNNKFLILNSLLEQIQLTLASPYLQEDLYFIIDAIVFKYFEQAIFSKIEGIGDKSILIEAKEAQKNIEQCAKIWEFFFEKAVSRKALIIIIGGGITLDLGAFACSAWKRGVFFYLVPSTLLAMADACVGGKTGFNFKEVKNLIGSFAMPAQIWLAPELLATLPPREFRAGLAEILKIALVADSDFWFELSGFSPSQDSDIMDIVMRAIALKKSITEKDPTEIGLRKILNFGHTLGHALEAAAIHYNFSLLHGEAVALGMLLESKIAFKLGKITTDELTQIQTQLMQKQLLTPIPSQFCLSSIRSFLQQDKKNHNQSFRFALPEGIGKGCWDVAVEWNIIEEVIQQFRNETSCGS
jgi:3-dehydroquinate synthase